MNTTLLEQLRKIDTPTVCNAIEVAQGKRGFNRFTRRTFVASEPEALAMVGYACTARIAALEPLTEDPEIIRSRRLDYYQHMANAPKPSVAVIEDMDEPNCIGAFWGEINATIHKAFGLKGVITNGVMRDLGDVPSGFPMLAGSLGPSHGYVHVREIGGPVNVFGMSVSNGELIHADRHGALVIPEEVLGDLERSIQTLFASEKLVLESAREADFGFDEFKVAWEAFERART